jgi:hypothetical protein
MAEPDMSDTPFEAVVVQVVVFWALREKRDYVLTSHPQGP